MNPLVIVGVLGKGFKAMVLVTTYWPIIHLTLVCFGIASVYNYLRALMETPMFYLFAMWYDLNFDIYIPEGMANFTNNYIPEGMANFTNNYIPNGIANFTNNTMFRPVSGFSSRFVKRFLNPELIVMLVCVSSILLNVFFICNKGKESSPKLENDDWQGIWRGLGKVLEAWGPAVSWDFTLEHLWDPEKLSQYLSQGLCGLHKSKEVQLIWGLACAYRALYNTIRERESFRAEVQAKGENPQVKSNQSQETPVTIPVAPVEGKKWKRVSSRLERKREEEEEEEEDPGEGPSSEPPPSRKAKAKTKRHAEESDEEEVSITTRRPLKMTEIQGSRKEFTRRLNESIVSWLVRCWDSGAHSLSLDGNEARQLGAIARDPAIDRGISRCSDEAASLWERVLTAVKEKYPFKNSLKIAMKKWDTVEKGIQYLREIGVVEMLYDPDFVPNHPQQNRDPERVRTTPEIWQKIVTTAPDKYAATLTSACDRYQEQQRTPLIYELIVTLQNYEQLLSPIHSAVAAISRMTEQVSQLINRDKPVAVSETLDEDQDNQMSLAKEVKEMKEIIRAHLTKDDKPSFLRARSKISAVRGRRSPAQVRNNAPRITLWYYLRDHGEDMGKWHGQPTPVLRARVKELQGRSTTSAVAPVTTGNE
ncbi:uncharacterized protein LOC125686424 [Lagopus muta]|uniref:uncharacterized protein LOC125686424 n=1 Tax=Lagopus muta TaxID=64668 RepID=UPI0020A12294|nr:uncharacterized protein LOC125686424 [Lagopus muta]